MRRTLIAVALAMLLMPAAAHAAFPGANGKIAFVHSGGISTMNPDGTAAAQIVSGAVGAPAWSPDGTRIAFHRTRQPCPSQPCEDIYIVNGDGTGETLAIPNGGQPTWSPGGDQIAFTATGTEGYIYRANTDGSNRTLLYSWEDADIYGIGGPAWAPESPVIMFHEGTLESACNPDLEECADLYPGRLYTVSSARFTQFPGGPGSPGAGPNWSPDGTRVTFYTSLQHPEFPVGDVGGRIGTMNRDGTNRQLLTPGAHGYFENPGFDKLPAWSPDGARLAFERNGDGLHVMNADGTGDVRITASGRDPDWQPVPIESAGSHIRPKTATPFYVSLVPAYRPCAAPNRTHGPPLAFPSCNPPWQPPGPPNGPPYLTIGVGDGSPALARGSGSVRMEVQLGAPGPPEDSDVMIRFSLTNVMRTSNLSEYTGELRTELTVRRTDRDGLGFAPHSTSMDFPFGFTVQCNPTPGSSLDASSCVSFTSANAAVPGAVKDTNRAIWALEKLRVYDGGIDEDADTEAGNSLFATQGVFVP